MKYLLVLLCLSACADPQPIFKPVTVDVPVSVPCHITQPDRPDFAMNHITVGDNLADKTRAALIELDQRKEYEARLQSQITICN